jgi:formamidopyrimidine-DNA glycosylase
LPELPEVETIKRQLNKTIKKKKIRNVRTLYPKIIKGEEVKNLKKLLKNKVVQKVKRRAKLLFVELSGDFTLIFHLRMTGQLIFKNQNEQFDKHVHLIIYFEDGGRIYYRDIRKFGLIKLVKTNEISNQPEVKKLGIEPLGNSLNISRLRGMMERRKAAIKALLLRQDLVAGLGNIYADEILFEAGILPKRKGGSLNKKENQEILNAIRKILKKAIKEGGTTFRDYVGINGKKGNYVKYLKVYRREGKHCFRCYSQIERIKISGRSSYYCPSCQK